MRVCPKLAIIFYFRYPKCLFFFLRLCLLGILLNSKTEVSTIPFLQTQKPKLCNGIGSTPAEAQPWTQNQSASLLDLASTPLFAHRALHTPQLKGRVLPTPCATSSLSLSPLSLGSRGALPGMFCHPQGDEGLETFVPLIFARELYLATKWRPGVGSLNIDSNKWAIFKFPENPQNIWGQNVIYRALWALEEKASPKWVCRFKREVSFNGVGGGTQPLSNWMSLSHLFAGIELTEARHSHLSQKRVEVCCIPFSFLCTPVLTLPACHVPS